MVLHVVAFNSTCNNICPSPMTHLFDLLQVVGGLVATLQQVREKGEGLGAGLGAG